MHAISVPLCYHRRKTLKVGLVTKISGRERHQHKNQTIFCIVGKFCSYDSRDIIFLNIVVTNFYLQFNQFYNFFLFLKGISLTKKEDGQRSLDENVITPIDENSLPEDTQERNKKLDVLLWDRIRQFVETRSLQLKVNKLFFNDNSELDIAGDGKYKKKGVKRPPPPK